MSGLGSLGAWAWRRYGEEIRRAQEDSNTLNYLRALGRADAFEEMTKYIEQVQQAREEHGGKA